MLPADDDVNMPLMRILLIRGVHANIRKRKPLDIFVLQVCALQLVLDDTLCCSEKVCKYIDYSHGQKPLNTCAISSSDAL